MSFHLHSQSQHHCKHKNAKKLTYRNGFANSRLCAKSMFVVREVNCSIRVQTNFRTRATKLNLVHKNYCAVHFYCSNSKSQRFVRLLVTSSDNSSSKRLVTCQSSTASNCIYVTYNQQCVPKAIAILNLLLLVAFKSKSLL